MRHQDFLTKAGWPNARIEARSEDASFRRYFTVTAEGRGAILMDAPPDKEKPAEFQAIAEHLRSLGLSAPRIFAADIAAGLILLEDFGDATFTNLLANGHEERTLYALAIDTLAALQNSERAVEVDCPPYDRPTLLEEAGRFVLWYYAAKTGAPAPELVRQSYLVAWDKVFETMAPAKWTLVLRDYHVDNLMLLESRAGVEACGLLDFQDALIGPAAYDLVSLLEDARRDVPPDLAAEMVERFLAARPSLDRQNFMTWYHVLGAQRHTKIAGLFTRLWLRDGKPVYLGHIPRELRQLGQSLEHEILSPVKHWMEQNLPDYQDMFAAMGQADADRLTADILQSLER